MKSTQSRVAVRSKGGPRKPSRGLGVVRFNALVDATEKLLCEYNPEDIGIYQIAEAADAPTASAYHFFPTRDAAFLALAERYLATLVGLAAAPVEAAALRSWQDLFEIDSRRTMEFYNNNLPAMKIFYSGFGSTAVREADIGFTKSIAGSVYRRMDSVFHMPLLKDAPRVYHIGLAITDAIWAISFQQHGEITSKYFQEGLAACEAYHRLYLPAHVEPRSFCLEAAARGETIELPPLTMQATD
jgi:AcrR family transcriptional regulator